MGGRWGACARGGALRMGATDFCERGERRGGRKEGVGRGRGVRERNGKIGNFEG